MQNVLDQTGGLIFLFLFGAVMIALTAWVGRGRRRDNAEFLLASRSIGVLPGAMSIAASWIWAPALFIASQKAYEQGIAGLFWFTFPNVMALVVFAPLALRIRERFPSGYTLPQFMGSRHGRSVHVLYLIQFLAADLLVCRPDPGWFGADWNDDRVAISFGCNHLGRNCAPLFSNGRHPSIPDHRFLADGVDPDDLGDCGFMGRRTSWRFIRRS